MSSELHCAIELPGNFRREETLAFHRRDPQGGSERVSADRLEKGLIWDGSPARLRIHFGAARVEAELAVDGQVTANASQRLEEMLRRMLGLTQRVEDFERTFGEHPRLGRLIADRPGLRVAVAATPFEALSWAVIGQQISVSAAVAVRRRLIEAVGIRHSGGLLCAPGAEEVATLSGEALRAAGCSETKARTLTDIAEQAASGELPLGEWATDSPASEIGQRLIAVRGIGPWTVSYTLLRGFGWLDGSLHGDVAVRRGLQLLLEREEKVSAQEAEEWLAEFSPWRALVAAHLWAVKSAAAY